MRFLIIVVALLWATTLPSWATCGDRGGPAFRLPNGKCAAWKDLDRTCGSPPTTRCSFEGGGIGATSLAQGQKFIATMMPLATATAAPALTDTKTAPAAEPTRFNKRAIRANGVACTSQSATAETATCLVGKAAPADCKARMDEALKKGLCIKILAGTEATIEAGSHSFDWVRIRVPGQVQPVWSQRQLVLD